VATSLIDHEWPYNENVSAPQSWGDLILGRPPWGFRRVGVNKSYASGESFEHDAFQFSIF
jgi:hypothetical protein